MISVIKIKTVSDIGTTVSVCVGEMEIPFACSAAKINLNMNGNNSLNIETPIFDLDIDVVADIIETDVISKIETFRGYKSVNIKNILDEDISVNIWQVTDLETKELIGRISNIELVLLPNNNGTKAIIHRIINNTNNVVFLE